MKKKKPIKPKVRFRDIASALVDADDNRSLVVVNVELARAISYARLKLKRPNKAETFVVDLEQ
jgi:hypothetical protein